MKVYSQIRHIQNVPTTKQSLKLLHSLENTGHNPCDIIFGNGVCGRTPKAQRTKLNNRLDFMKSLKNVAYQKTI